MTVFLELAGLGPLTTGALPFTGTSAITRCLWVRTCSSLHKSFLGGYSPYPAPKARLPDYSRASTSSENILSYLKGVKEKPSIQGTFFRTKSKIQ